MATKTKRVFHAVIWDWNGTLLKDIPYFYRHVLIPLLETLGADLSAYETRDGYEELRYEFSMLGPKRFVRMVAIQQGLKIDWGHDVQPFVDELYSAKTHPLNAGAKDTLDVLRREHEVPQGIISGMPHEKLLAAIEEKKIADYFRMRRGGISHKTQSFISFLQHVHCDRDDLRHRVLLISDIHKDLQEGQKAGLTVVGIPGYGNRESLEEAEPFAVVDRITQILSLGEFRPLDWS